MTQIKLFFLVCIGICFLCTTANAQTIIRDAEIETYLSEWFEPIFEANNLQADQVNIILVQSDEINAFVAGGANIFFYTGLINMTDSPSELIGVMAHELGHIQGGHLIRGRDALERASYESLLGTIIGLGSAILSGDSGAAAAGQSAGNSIAQRRFLTTSRTYEASADQAAITAMSNASLPTEGLLTFLKKLEGQEFLAASQQVEYVRTHPLTHTRISAVEKAVNNSKTQTTPKEWDDQHARMIAKLKGYINPEQVSWDYDLSDQSIPALYAHAIAAYRQDNKQDALKRIDALLSKEPNNAYFHELKGQVLVEFGEIDRGLQSYETALSYLPGSGLILMAAGQALIQKNNNMALTKAIKYLNKAAIAEPNTPHIHRLLATAFGRSGNEAMAQLHLAEEALLKRQCSRASANANRAISNANNNQIILIRAKDILDRCQIIQKKR